MFKKAFKTLPLLLIMILSFSMSVFADNNFTLRVDNEKSISGESSVIIPRGPAAPVTSVEVTDGYVKNGRCYVEITVIGYGDNFFWLDGGLIKDYTIGTLGKPEVYGFVYTYDCGALRAGSTHSFKFQTTSYNSPWNTETVSGSFTVPQ